MVVVHSPDADGRDPGLQGGDRRASSATLQRRPAVRTVVAPRARRVDLRATATPRSCRPAPRATPTRWSRAADGLKGKLHKLSTGDGVQVNLTGAAGMWSDFNAANRSAMLKSEVISWPVTLGILLLAFGSLVAAGLPLMLTMLGLLAAAGSLYLGTLSCRSRSGR